MAPTIVMVGLMVSIWQGKQLGTLSVGTEHIHGGVCLDVKDLATTIVAVFVAVKDCCKTPNSSLSLLI
nr:hypothetical protein Itr_chr14CG05070 [Ipomoea trifida]